MLFTLMAFLLALGILVVFHELGHYTAARLCGVKVLRFSFGFGPVLARWQSSPDKTEWVVSAVPLGGYVSMLEQSQPGLTDTERVHTFEHQTVWRRMLIVAAGPLANLLLAFLLYCMMYLHGIPAMRPLIDEPPANTPAAVAGLHAGDEIARVGQDATPAWDDLDWALLQHAGDTVPVILTLSNGETRRISMRNTRLDDEKQPLNIQLGLSPWQPPIPAVIEAVLPDSVAQQAGLRAGDVIDAVNGKHMDNWQQLAALVRLSPNTLLHLHILRNGQSLLINVTPARVDANGVMIGRIGAAPKVDERIQQRLATVEQYGIWQAMAHAWHRTGESIALNLKVIRQLVTGRASMSSVTGPVTIADYAGKTARMGWLAFASFLALVSVGLGVLNLLPVPILDGGHLLYHMVELVKGSPVSEQTIQLGQRVGMALLLTLMTFAFYNDITRLLGS